MDLLGAMRAFRRVVERRSFSRAAEDLGTSRARLSTQIKMLEEHLGAVLLNRTTRTMGLTDVGAEFYAESVRILERLDALESSVAATTSKPTGLLRISAPVSYGLTTLAPLVARFAAAHPSVRIDLQMDDAIVDLVSNSIDVAVRIRPQLEESSLIARRIGGVTQVLCASPAYLKQRGRPSVPGDLGEHDRLSYALSADVDSWPLTGPSGAETIQFTPRFRANNSMALRQAILAGLGVGALPSFLADPEVAAGALARVLPEWSFEPRQIYLVYPSSRHLQPKVRAFVDFITQALPEGD